MRSPICFFGEKHIWCNGELFWYTIAILVSVSVSGHIHGVGYFGAGKVGVGVDIGDVVGDGCDAGNAVGAGDVGDGCDVVGAGVAGDVGVENTMGRGVAGGQLRQSLPRFLE